jgi:hypothetical protein
MPIDPATRQAALQALAAIQEYSRQGFEHGVDRVYLHYDDVEGDWLNEFIDEEPLSNVCSLFNSTQNSNSP